MSKKYNSESFIEKSNQIHNFKYNYSKTIYNGSRYKVIITCPIHGDFSKRADQHLYGQGCPKCGYSNVGQDKKYSLEQFVSKVNSIHNNKYDYSFTDYINVDTKIKIICPIHGIFEQLPKSHLQGRGCPECGNILQANANLKDTSQFILEAKLIHGDRYNYSKVNYITGIKKVSIICSQHGKFTQTPASHLQGKGCPHCNRVGYTRTNWIKFCNSKPNSTPTTYIIRCFNEFENFIKIGITSNNVQKRFSDPQHMPYSYEILKEFKGSPDFVFDKEKELHRLYKNYRHNPCIKFSGSTECFNISILSSIK